MLAGDKTQSESTDCLKTDGETPKVKTDQLKKKPKLNHYAAAVEEVIPALEEIISGYEKGSYTLGADGTPDKTTLQAVKKVVEGIASRVEFSPHEKKHFLDFLERAMIRWFKDCVLQSQGIATLRFQRMLTSISSKLSE